MYCSFYKNEENVKKKSIIHKHMTNENTEVAPLTTEGKQTLWCSRRACMQTCKVKV